MSTYIFDIFKDVYARYQIIKLIILDEPILFISYGLFNTFV